MEDNDPMWANCPAGTLREMAHALRTARRKRRIVQMAGPTIGLLFVLLWAGFVVSTPQVRGITCAEVTDRLVQYKDKQLDSSLSARLSRHLAKCPNCRRRYTLLVSGDN